MVARRLILVGGGHSHVLVLADLIRTPEPSLQPIVVAPSRFTTYSGMVPGVIARQYALRDAQIDVAALARRAGAEFIDAPAVGIDAQQRCVSVRDHAPLSYDLISFDIGSQPAPTASLDADAPLIALKPIEAAVAAIDAALSSPSAIGRHFVVVGAGAGGTEVALALRARLRTQPSTSITICDLAARPVAERSERTSALVERAFADGGIRFRGGVKVDRVSHDAVHLAAHSEIPADLVVWATGAGAPPMFAQSGLPVDRGEHLWIGPDLRCPSHPEIFAAGDCATLTTHPDLPKAGVYAVREGPVLAHNLRAAARGESLRCFRPQRRFLALLNTGDGRAIASYGHFAWRGRWAWRLKDWIDRRFVAQFR